MKELSAVQPDSFLRTPNDYVIMGEFEEVLVEMADTRARGTALEDVENVSSLKRGLATTRSKRSQFRPPDRSTLPSLSTYARTPSGAVIGNVETMRGCAHDCTYCSVYAAYNKRVIKIADEAVHHDLDQVIEMGAAHITFIDADFYSTGTRGHRILESLKARHPNVTFDITARLDDLLRYRHLVRELKGLGCTEITTAVEFPSDRVLSSVTKRITLEQTRQAIRFCNDVGLRVRPTFITFNPWINRRDFAALDAFIAEMGLGGAVDELQRETRLLLYKGSPLLKTAAQLGLNLVEHETYFEWKHPDPEMDELYRSVLTPGSDVRKRCCIKG